MEISKAFTFDDILLEPRKSSVQPKNCSTSTFLTKNLKLDVPIISAAMDTVSESKLAIAMAQLGGAACIHKNMTVEQQVSEVLKVKKFESGMVIDPITIGPNNLISDVKKIIREKNISGIPVVDNSNKILGIITNRDLRFSSNDNTKVKDLMTKMLLQLNKATKLMMQKSFYTRIELKS